MTHDELLAEINKELEITHWEAWHEGARALLAVAELHKPTKNRSIEGWCDVCTDYYQYPCPTIQAINKELG